jgi:hypothetical protein
MIKKAEILKKIEDLENELSKYLPVPELMDEFEQFRKLTSPQEKEAFQQKRKEKKSSLICLPDKRSYT